MALTDVLHALGHDESDRVAIVHRPRSGAGPMIHEWTTARHADAVAAPWVTSCDLWFSVHPTANGVASRSNDNAVGIGCWPADLDYDKLPDGAATADLIIDDLSGIIGEKPCAVVESGHGRHAYWRAERLRWDASDTIARQDAARALGQWKAVVQTVAAGHGGSADAVFDLARIMRVPRSWNFKADPAPVVGTLIGGGVVTVAAIKATHDLTAPTARPTTATTTNADAGAPWLDAPEEHREGFREALAAEGQHELRWATDELDEVAHLAEGEHPGGIGWEDPDRVGAYLRLAELQVSTWAQVSDLDTSLGGRGWPDAFIRYVRASLVGRKVGARPVPLAYGPTADPLGTARAWSPNGVAATNEGAPPTSKRSAKRSSDEDDEKPSVATQLVQLALKRYTFGQSTEGEPFALPRNGRRVARLLRGSSDSLRAELAHASATRSASGTGSSIAAAPERVLSASASALCEAARPDGSLWLDLGDTTGRAVRLDATGHRVETGAPVLFRRTPLSGPLPAPLPGGSLGELWALVNVAEQDRPVVAAVLVSMLLPDIPHPVVIVDGEQGAGKSQARRVLAGLLDPSPVPLRKPPRDVESWTTAAAGSWVVAVDNVSHLPPWLSDSLCRAASGDGDVRRKLYSDGDLHVFAFRRCVILNGIDVTGVRDDLADRAVTIRLERLTGRRREDAVLQREWAEAHPRILGALLDLAARVLAALPSVRLDDPPRMIDFARVLAAVDTVVGTDGLARYVRLADELAAEAITGDPVLAAITVDVQAEWIGTGAALLAMLDSGRWAIEARPREWPRTAQAMSGVLRRRGPAMRQTGWQVDDLGRGGHDKALRWRLVPPTEGGSTP